MKQSLFTLEHARQLTEDTYELVLSGDTSAITAPGQFVNIALPGKFLRRPISICTWNREALILLVKVVGAGSHDLVRCVPGTELDVLSGLGNGFDLTPAGDHPVLAGGGIGVAPLYGLAQLLLERGGGGGTLLSVYEKYSFDNAAAAGLEGGLICSVLRYSRWELEQLLTGDMGGCAVFARDEDELGERYYLLYTPTDAQFFPAGGGVADTESDEFARWTELKRTVPALVADGITGANGLTPCTTGELTADYTYESGEHIQIRYSYIEDEAYDDVVLILSQPSRQGEGGIWCVERYIDAERNVYLCFPGAVGEEARDYYDRAQRRVDAGEEQWRLEPLEVARDFVENSGEWPEPPLDRGSYEIMD